MRWGGSWRPKIPGPAPGHGARAPLKINLAVIILSHIIHHVSANSLLSFFLFEISDESCRSLSVPPTIATLPPVQTVGVHIRAACPWPPLSPWSIKHHTWPWGARAKKPLSVSECVSHEILYTLLGFVFQCGSVQCVFLADKTSRCVFAQSAFGVSVATGEIRRVSESRAWCAAARQSGAAQVGRHMQGSYSGLHHFGWWNVCVCVFVRSCARLTAVLPTWAAPLFFPPAFPVFALPSKLYSWEDEWLSSWPLPRPDNALPQRPNRYFLFFCVCGRLRRAATSGQFKAATTSVAVA